MLNERANRILRKLLDMLVDTPESAGYLGQRTDGEYSIDDGVEWQPGDSKPGFVKEGLKGWREL